MQLFRVLKIQPQNGYERVRLTLSWHEDAWYVDTYGIAPDPESSNQRRNKLERASYPWAPYKVQPESGDPMFPREEWTFGIQVTPADDGTYSNLLCTGRVPVNDFSSAISSPVVQRQGTMAAGGSLLGGGWTYYWAVCAYDADGRITPPGEICETLAYAPGTFTATIPILFWDASTVGYHLFGGFSPVSMTWQASSATTPATIDVAALLDMTWGCPDQEFDGIEIAIKREIHGGIWGAECNAVAERALTFVGAGVGVDYTGRILSLVSKADGSAVPLLNFAIASNTDDVLTIAGTSPDPNALGVAAGDVFVLRSQGTIVDKTVTDLLWMNPVSNAGAGLAVSAEKGYILRVISGTGCGYRYMIADNDATSITIADEWIQTPDATSVFIVEEPAWLPDSAELAEPNNADPAAETTLVVPVRNWAGSTLLVIGFTRDGGGNMPPEQMCPFREVYVSQNVGDALDLTGVWTLAGQVTY